MIRKILLILLCILMLLLAALFSGYFYRVKLLSTILSSALEVPVTVKAIDLSKNGAVIKRLSIQNPPGCVTKHALIADTIDIKINWPEFTKTFIKKQKIILDSINIDESQMWVELFTVTGSDTNWSRIIDKIAASPPPPIEITFEIKKLILTNIELDVKYLNLPQALLNASHIAKIELNDIGSGKGVDSRELFFIISKVLIQNAAAQLDLKTMIPQMLLERVLPLPFLEVEVVKQIYNRIFNPKKNKEDQDQTEEELKTQKPKGSKGAANGYKGPGILLS